MSTGAGMTIPTVRPNLSLLVAALVIAVAAGYLGGWHWAPLTAFTVLICAGVYRILALLGYIAALLQDDDR